jgi:hypothetical protein
MKKILIASFLLFIPLLSGCSVKYAANSVAVGDMSSKEICVIEDTSVNKAFLPAYRAALEKKGFTVKTLRQGSALSACPLTSTYTGRWSWDFVLYMASAEIVVYRNGAKAGDAVYDAPKAGWALTTEIYDSTETKITQMVNKLFPDVGLSK